MTDKEGIAELTEQRDTPASVGTVTPLPPAANTANGSIFSQITPTLSDPELVNPAVIKMIMELMRRAEAERDERKAELKKLEPLYYAANTEVAVLRSKAAGNTVVDIFFATGMALGGAAAGFVPFFWDKEHVLPTVICGVFSAILFVIAVVVRVYGWKK